MPPPSCSAPAPAAEVIAARLLASLEGLDLASADGRAGLNTLLAEIERACPGVILQQAARIELRAVGWRSDASRRDDGRDASRRDDAQGGTGGRCQPERAAVVTTRPV